MQASALLVPHVPVLGFYIYFFIIKDTLKQYTVTLLYSLLDVGLWLLLLLTLFWRKTLRITAWLKKKHEIMRKTYKNVK